MHLCYEMLFPEKLRLKWSSEGTSVETYWQILIALLIFYLNVICLKLHTINEKQMPAFQTALWASDTW